LAQYAQAKHLPEEFLRGLGLRDLFIGGRSAVAIPYREIAGTDGSVRFRMALEGPDRFRWRKGSKLTAYGLWRLAEARRAGHITLVEGESDAQTLWFHGIPALGIPGSNTWREEWADHLRDIPTIYVLVEPDAGGERVLAWLARSSIRQRAHLVTLEGVKDPSALHIADPDHFIERWNAALAAAPTWVDREQRMAGDRREQARTQCRTLAEAPDILSRFTQAVAGHGVAGEERAVKLLYLQATSRFLQAPVSLILKGPSAAGKSYLANRVLDFFPRSAYYALTAMSERALAYSEEPLSHRLLVIYEAAGIHGDFATYIVRSLLSEGRVSYETVEKTPQGLRARRIERAGPTNLLVTTTAVALHPENETRMLSVPITDTQDQTRRVLLAIAEGRQQPVDFTAWHALQEWLALSDHRVHIPYARRLASLISPVATRLRRDFQTILSLVRAHAILHQATRERSQDGAVVATIADYAAIHELVADLVSEGVEATVSRTVRETVEAVQALLRDRPSRDEAAVSLTALATRLELDMSSARRRVQIALRMD
jgi:hypothetical protein